MSNKDFYDEDEVISSMVDEKVPRPAKDSQSHNQTQMNGHPNIRIYQGGCGCFDTRKMMINFLIYSVVLMITAGLFPGFYLDGIFATLHAALILTLLNTFVKPLIIFFTFPITMVTLGLFYLVINGIIITMTANIMGESFLITNFFVAFFAAIFISILQSFIRKKILKVDQL